MVTKERLFIYLFNVIQGYLFKYQLFSPHLHFPIGIYDNSEIV